LITAQRPGEIIAMHTGEFDETGRWWTIPAEAIYKRIHMADYVKDGVPFYRSKEVIERSKGNKISTELFITRQQFDAIERKFGCPYPSTLHSA
jgi:hypothetical protein